MKVILAGASGFVGGGALEQCIANESITSILVLTRRDLPDGIANNPKVSIVLHQDFSTYPESLLQQLAGAEACIWAIGGLGSKFPSAAVARTVNLDYTLSAARAFATLPVAAGKIFRFVYCSGALAERDLAKSLWYFQDARRTKGETETGLLALQQEHKPKFEVRIVRPAAVLAKDALITEKLMTTIFSVRVDALGAVMVDLALHGGEELWMNPVIVSKGKELLEAKG